MIELILQRLISYPILMVNSIRDITTIKDLIAILVNLALLSFLAFIMTGIGKGPLRYHIRMTILVAVILWWIKDIPTTQTVLAFTYSFPQGIIWAYLVGLVNYGDKEVDAIYHHKLFAVSYIVGFIVVILTLVAVFLSSFT